MKTIRPLISLAILAAAATSVTAQTAIFRCPGNVYTNSQAEAQAKGCKLMEGGNVTVVTGTRVATSGSGVKVVSAPSSVQTPAPKVDAGEQKARDSDAKA